MSEIEKFLKKIPPVTKYYLASVFVTTFLITYPILKVVQYMVMDYEMAVYKFQIWRFITNFFIVGKFSFNFLFFLMMTYQTLIAFENRAIAQRKYSELAMMLFYLCFFLIFINFLLQYKVYLSMELLFGMIYIDSKRDPEKPVSLWGFRMKNAYLPFAFLFLSMITGGDLLGDLMGIVAGHIYYYLNDIVPVTFRKTFLLTPGFVKRYLDNPRLYEPVVQHNYTNNNNDQNNFRNRFDNNNANNSNPNNNTGNRGNSSGGFQAFSGRGTTIG